MSKRGETKQYQPGPDQVSVAIQIALMRIHADALREYNVAFSTLQNPQAEQSTSEGRLPTIQDLTNAALIRYVAPSPNPHLTSRTADIAFANTPQQQMLNALAPQRPTTILEEAKIIEGFRLVINAAKNQDTLFEANGFLPAREIG